MPFTASTQFGVTGKPFKYQNLIRVAPSIFKKALIWASAWWHGELLLFYPIDKSKLWHTEQSQYKKIVTFQVFSSHYLISVHMALFFAYQTELAVPVF
jgi:hypothetical protein